MSSSKILECGIVQTSVTKLLLCLFNAYEISTLKEDIDKMRREEDEGIGAVI